MLLMGVTTSTVQLPVLNTSSLASVGDPVSYSGERLIILWTPCSGNCHSVSLHLVSDYMSAEKRQQMRQAADSGRALEFQQNAAVECNEEVRVGEGCE